MTIVMSGFFFLDFYKALDVVEHPFIFKTLQHFGFGVRLLGDYYSKDSETMDNKNVLNNTTVNNTNVNLTNLLSKKDSLSIFIYTVKNPCNFTIFYCFILQFPIPLKYHCKKKLFYNILKKMLNY
ncbi:MAG: hypothetical protein ACRCSY_05330 [Cetobacterium sp.]